MALEWPTGSNRGSPWQIPFDPDNRYTLEEMAQIQAYSSRHFEPLFEEMGVKMEVRHCGKTVEPELKEWNGKAEVIATTPMNHERGVKMFVREENRIPEGKKARFEFSAGHEQGESWNLKLRKGGKIFIDTLVTADNSRGGWMDFSIDIPEFAGKEEINLEIHAENAGEASALNYWGNFRIRVE